MSFDLTETQKNILIEILKKHIKKGEIIIFGSRAKQSNTEHSDVDIAIRNGAFLKGSSICSLCDELDESDFPYLTDVLEYEKLENPALKEHIDSAGKVLVVI
ncbi:nucleotidyltransferase family protein [Treponema phagedenis]|uniref:Nucleotidyltransferase domain-containing protein n=1 Tax=Treponema phagedenis TaxID=162 RepID=A0A0B7GUQ6_TREPH|nr:nucleotidyltransferase domain-containing protein [Treponema phagedenis]NVP23143.1 nucleotidyltransferase domain-containing protein [Treponema phagedenis]QEJ95408.1 nucleotidyltransferase domain-containing protein [Treponema phagedenis]QEJ98049.1 nucleotidyltransferase domain-containing protein [Treponema phagedenis]QEK01262.1 nucleotidyltransferase domain-containing protein [Treponema phagedenis]QEK03554.1 nucleotidyltransferase domain-containing protein [Treponema phagedenis]